MIIYADILFLVNLIADWFLIIACGRFLNVKYKRWRVLLASLFGAGYSFIMLANLNKWLLLLTKIVACAVMILIAYKVKNFMSFLRLTLSFIIVNFLFGGCVGALYLALDTDKIYSDFSGVYFDISPLMLIVFIVISYVVVVLSGKLISVRRRNKESFTVKVDMNGSTYTFCAFSDSGNFLTEPFSGYPVVFIKRGIIPEKDMPEVKRAILANSVSSSEVFMGFTPESMEIKGEKCFLKTKKVYICESDNILKNSHFDMILSEKIFESEECTENES